MISSSSQIIGTTFLPIKLPKSSEHSPEIKSRLRGQVRALASLFEISDAEDVLLTGSYRAVDPLILQAAGRLPKSAKILEAGGGTTFPLSTLGEYSMKVNPNFSCPFIARLLAQDGHHVTMIDEMPSTVSVDRSDSAATFVVRSSIGGPERSDFFCSNMTFLHRQNMMNYVSCDSEGGMVTIDPNEFLLSVPAAYAQIPGKEGFKFNLAYPELDRLLAVQSVDKEILRGAEFWPTVIPSVERELFGLDAYGGVNLKEAIKQRSLLPENLRAQFEEGYDLIFLRNLARVKDGNGLFVAELARLLKPGGTLLFEISCSDFGRAPPYKMVINLEDRSKLSREIKEINPNMQIDFRELEDAELIVVEYT